MVKKSNVRVTITLPNNLFKLIILGSKECKMTKSQFIKELLTISITNVLDEGLEVFEE